MRIILFSIIVYLGGLLPSYAHWGHVGELAGHGHVIAIGALAGAAALAAALRRPKRDDTEPQEETEEDAGAAGEVT